MNPKCLPKNVHHLWIGLEPLQKMVHIFLGHFGTRIGDKPGLETCVVSQVMADSLARLPLEG